MLWSHDDNGSPLLLAAGQNGIIRVINVFKKEIIKVTFLKTKNKNKKTKKQKNKKTKNKKQKKKTKQKQQKIRI